MNALWPCHSSTPKSLSKSSVMVYQGMRSQPIRAFKRLISFSRRARREHERGVARGSVREVGNMVGHHGAADARMFGPADDARLEERAIYNQLTAVVEQIEQASLAVGSVGFVILLHSQPWHPPTLCGQRVPGLGQLLLLRE